jgi:hypothetical protein
MAKACSVDSWRSTSSAMKPILSLGGGCTSEVQLEEDYRKPQVWRTIRKVRSDFGVQSWFGMGSSKRFRVGEKFV